MLTKYLNTARTPTTMKQNLLHRIFFGYDLHQICKVIKHQSRQLYSFSQHVK